MFQQASDIYRGLYESNPNSAQAARDFSVSLDCLGNFYLSRGQSGDAELALGCFMRSLRLDDMVFSGGPDSVGAIRNIVLSLFMVGRITLQLGDENHASAYFDRCGSILKKCKDDGRDIRDLEPVEPGLKQVLLRFEPPVLNPNLILLPEVVKTLVEARKVATLKARPAMESTIETLEGTKTVKKDDYICQGPEGELWPQSKVKLDKKYFPEGDPDAAGWQTYVPRPDLPPVFATRIGIRFQVINGDDRLSGKAGDYLVTSSKDSNDVWIVDGEIFIKTYKFSSDFDILSKGLWIP